MSPIVQSGPLALFFAFVIVHALADIPFLGSYLAAQKQRPRTGGSSSWVIALTAHSLIHAGGVRLISGLVWLGVAELVLHGAIDFAKGEDRIGYLSDQLLHLACKAAYVALIYLVIGNTIS